MSDPLITATVSLTEREVRALRLLVDTVADMGDKASMLQRAALPSAQSAVDKIAARFLPRS